MDRARFDVGAMMGLLRRLVLGRPDGFRSRLLAMLGLKQPSSEGGTGSSASTNTYASSNSSGSGVGHEPAEKALRLKHEPPRDVTPPEGYEVVLHKDALEVGKIIEVIIGGTAIAVARVQEEGGNKYFAIANKCPHADGPLGEGSLDGCVVSCPYHGWQFDVRDGSCKTNPYAHVQSYPVQVVGNAVCVKL